LCSRQRFAKKKMEKLLAADAMGPTTGPFAGDCDSSEEGSLLITRKIAVLVMGVTRMSQKMMRISVMMKMNRTTYHAYYNTVIHMNSCTCFLLQTLFLHCSA